MSTFKKLLESVDRRQAKMPVEIDLRQGGEIWHMSNDFVFEPMTHMTALGSSEALLSDAEAFDDDHEG